jgi:ferritin
MVNKFRLAGDTPAGLYQLDKELAVRVYNVPSPLAALDAAAGA